MLRSSYRQKSSSNKENRTNQSHYSFSKNIKAQIVDKATRKSSNCNFVDRVNGYIQAISPQNYSKGRRDKSQAVSNKTKKVNRTQRRPPDQTQLANKIKVEREMNRNLQKCIVEIQKMLWERNDRLESLEEQLREQTFTGDWAEKEEASNLSCKRIRQSQKELRKQVKTLGMRQLINKMEDYSGNEEDSPSERNVTESSLEENSYIKIRRPRTESESEGCSRKW